MAGLVGLALTSCKEDNPLGIMQKNEAPVVIPMEGVAVQSDWSPTGNTINLQNYVNTNEVNLFDVEISSAFAGWELDGEVQIAPTADFEIVQSIPLMSKEAATSNDALVAAVEGESDSYVAYVDVNDWNKAFVALYGLNPAANVNYLRYALRMKQGDQSLIMYNQDGEVWWGPDEFMVTPFDAGYDIADSYTLYYTLDGKETSVKMDHSSMFVYDDPVFTASVSTTKGQKLTWYVAPTDDADKKYGVVEGETNNESGSLLLFSEGGVAGEMETEDGTLDFSINMLDVTYTIEQIANFDYLYTPGGSNSWSQKNSQMLSTTDHVTYTGYAYLDGEFKFTSQEDWDGINFGAGEAEGTLSKSGEAGNLKVDKAGLYYLSVNIKTLTYTATLIETISMIGAFNDWGGDVQMTASKDYLTWTGNLDLTADSQWKFRMNNAWAINLGAGETPGDLTSGVAYSGLVRDGGNLTLPAGTYTVTLDLSKYPYSCTAVAK